MIKDVINIKERMGQMEELAKVRKAEGKVLEDTKGEAFLIVKVENGTEVRILV